MCKDIFFAAVNDCIPKYKQKRKTTARWITKDLIKLSRKKKLVQKGKKVRKRGSMGHPQNPCLLYTSPSPRDLSTSRMPSSA